jgi:hypothetical protein
VIQSRLKNCRGLVIPQVRDHASVDRRDRDEQGDPVEPAHEPAVSGTRRELRVLIERAGHRIVAAQLAEDERHEQHPDHATEKFPNSPRTRFS